MQCFFSRFIRHQPLYFRIQHSPPAKSTGKPTLANKDTDYIREKTSVFRFSSPRLCVCIRDYSKKSCKAIPQMHNDTVRSYLIPENHIGCGKNHVLYSLNYIRYNLNYIRPFFAACKPLTNSTLYRPVEILAIFCKSKGYVKFALMRHSWTAVQFSCAFGFILTHLPLER